jgi:hypothetical protein
MRITSAGNVLIGTTTATNNLRLNQKAAVVSVGNGNVGGMSLTSYTGVGADQPSVFDLQRSRGTTDGSLTAVASGDALGSIIFRGSNGSAFSNAAWVRGEVDSGTISGTSMPGRLVLSTTPSGSTTPVERMRIAASGELLTGGKTTVTANGGDVQVSSGISFPATQVAKSDPNTLDDYEEGTWTPTVVAEVNCSSSAFNASTRYTKIGRKVVLEAVGSLTVTATGTRVAIVFGGLPFSIGERIGGGGLCTNGSNEPLNPAISIFSSTQGLFQFWPFSTGSHSFQIVLVYTV